MTAWPALLLALLAAGCGPAAMTDQAASQSRSATAASPRTVVLLSHLEPSNLSQHRATAGTGITANDAIRIFNASLFIHDHKAGPRTYLAERRPQLNSESWRVLPDGRMETVYSLRRDAVWHDGTPLTVDDLVLSWRIAKLPELGVSELLPTRVIDEVVQLDPRTALVRWSQPFPRADALTGRDWAPLPHHILQGAYEAASTGRPEALISHPYYTRGHVGLGPYRLERWEPGAFIEGVAFDGHVFGRPKIDRVKVLFVGDPNTAVANLLAGEAHVAFDYTLGFEHGALLKRQWTAAGEVVFSPDRLRYIATQFKQEFASPRDILDLRVRKALAHALDRQPLVDVLLASEGTAAETMIPPTVEYYVDVERAIGRYPYDPRRTDQLLGEAGLSRAPGRWYSRSAGEPFSPELRGTATGQEEQETAIVADTWRRAGIDVHMRLLSEVEDRDRQVRSTYPAFAGQSSGLEEDTLLLKLYSLNSATSANRWAGSNRGGWAHPDYDRFYETLTSNLNAVERNRAVVEAMRLVSAELPIYPLYFNYVVQAHIAAIRGPQVTAAGGETTFSIHEWEWR